VFGKTEIFLQKGLDSQFRVRATDLPAGHNQPTCSPQIEKRSGRRNQRLYHR
jgi:hypothetical protein